MTAIPKATAEERVQSEVSPAEYDLIREVFSTTAIESSLATSTACSRR
jgi:hypothetical protein